jgi:hypothetical protein
MLHLLAYPLFHIYGIVGQNNLEREESIITFDFGIKIKKKKWILKIHVR